MTSHVIPATDTAPALRLYECGCSYRHDGGWAHCSEHTDDRSGQLVATATTVSRAQARREAYLRTNAGPRVEVRECHGGTMTLYHYDRPSWESKEDRP